MNAIALCVSHVNVYRAIHGVPLVSYSTQLEAHAQAWSDYMAATNQFRHSTGRYGENLAMFGSNTNNPCVRAVDRWYAENEEYDYLQSKFIFNAGHFTQLVWKRTTEVGIGIATSKNGITYVTMMYNPPGNVFGQFTQNVPLPKYLPPAYPPIYPPIYS